MNLKIVFTLLALFALNGIGAMAQTNPSGPRKENTLDQLNLKGPVKQINETQFKVSLQEGKVVKGDKISMYPAVSMKKFNPQGYITEWTFFKEDSAVYKSTRFIYDAGGHLVEETEYSPNGKMTSRDLHKFDARGYRSETTMETFGNSIDSKLIYKTDEKGNEVECLTYMNGKLFIRSTYTFDATGKKTGEKVYQNGTIPAMDITNKYDDRGNLIERKSYQSTGAFACYRHKFDEKGNETEWGAYEEDGTAKYRYVHTFNEQQDWVEEKEFESGDAVKRLRTFEYVYDNFGNWTRKTIFENGAPYNITERTIEYYE